MSDSSQSDFRWSDAWLLLAVGGVGEGPAALAQVLAVADAIQHAILSRQELNGGIARLLPAAAWSSGHDPQRAGDGEPEAFPPQAYEEALRAYYKQVGFEAPAR